MPMLLILCAMNEVDPATLMDGDVVYYKLAHTKEHERLQGPFTVVGSDKAEDYMLENINGGKFFLRTVTPLATFYKRATDD